VPARLCYARMARLTRKRRRARRRRRGARRRKATY
jgi:hypothetical protein